MTQEPVVQPPPGQVAAESSLPSTSTIRFVLLIVLVIVTSAAMGIYLSLLNGSIGDTVGQALRCMEQRGLALRDAQPQDALNHSSLLVCSAPIHSLQLQSISAAVLAVMMGAYLFYAVLPWWRKRRHRLAPLPADAVELRESLDALVRDIGLTRAPEFVIAPYNHHPAGLAFGRRGRPVVQLNVGLLPPFLTDPMRFRTIVLHELAHVRNRDIGITYFTVAVWRAFLLVALLPFAILNVFPNLVGGADRWEVTDLGNDLIRSTKLQSIAAVAALTALIYLARSAVLRSREHLADVTAAQYGAPALDSILAAAQQSPKGRPGWALLRPHPSPARRLHHLHQPSQRFRFDLAEVFAAGIAISGIGTSLMVVGNASVKQPPFLPNIEFAQDLVGLAVVLVHSVLIALYLGVIYWRVAVGERDEQVGEPGVIWTAAAMTAGILLGEPLSLAGALGGLRAGIFGGILAEGSFTGGLAAALILFTAVVLLARWTKDTARLRLTRRHGPSLRACLLTTSAIGGLALSCAFWIWYGLHGTDIMRRVEPWTPQLAQSRAEPYAALPGISWIMAQYMPLEYLAVIPFGPAALALPWAYILLISYRRPTVVTDAPSTPRVDLAVRTGLAGGGLYLAIVSMYAVLAAPWLSQILQDYDLAATKYLFYASFHLLAIVSALAAIVTVARTPRSGITLGLMASFTVTTMAAVSVILGFALVNCKTGDATSQQGSMLGCVVTRASRAVAAYPNLFTLMLPKAAVAAVLAGLVYGGVSSVIKRIRSTGSAPATATVGQPSPTRRGVVIFALWTVVPLVIALAVTITDSIDFFGRH